MMLKKTAFILRAGALALATATAACGGPGGPGAGQQGAPGAPQVPVAQVIVRDIAPSSEFNGALTAPKSVELRPRVSGQIVAVHVPEGGFVRRGQQLFRIDPRPFQVALDQALGQLAQAEAQAQLAAAEVDRAQRLVTTGAVSRKDYDAAVADNRARQAGVRAARASVAAARLDLSFTSVTAPINGRADRVLVTEGNMVAGGAQAAPLTTILSVDPLYVEFDVDEATYLGFVGRARQAGGTERLPVQVALMTDSGFPRSGTLDFLGNGVNRGAGTIRARAVIGNGDGALTPGLFAKVRLTTGSSREMVLVDDSAIGSDQGRNYALVLGKGSKVEYRPVTLGPVVDGLRVVQTGLRPGDTVILKGLVRPGMQVTPQRVPMQKPAAAQPEAGR